MKTKDYLKEKQPVVYQIFKNSFLKNKTSHAYIITGSKGSPLLDCAIFMAQSLVCQNKDEDNLACEECSNCQKILKHQYADFKFYNGEELKNDVTLALQEEFNKSSIEQENIKIYIIHLIEKVPESSLNKLLKFIEEPNSHIVAIFTSNSIQSVLQTIVSRCQIISLKEFMVNDLVQFLIANNVEQEDAWLISKISNNANNNLVLAQSENYKKIKEILNQSLLDLANADDLFIVNFQIQYLKDLNDEMLDIYLDMLEICLLEARIHQEDEQYQSLFFNESISKIAKKYQNLEQMINEINIAKVNLLSNANKSLVFDRLLINLLKG